MLSETLTTTYSRGVPVREWKPKKGVRTEVLDARVYGYAALCGLVSMGLRLDSEADRVEAMRPNGEQRSVVTPATGRKVLRSPWIDSGNRRI